MEGDGSRASRSNNPSASRSDSERKSTLFGYLTSKWDGTESIGSMDDSKQNLKRKLHEMEETDGMSDSTHNSHTTLPIPKIRKTDNSENFSNSADNFESEMSVFNDTMIGLRSTIESMNGMILRFSETLSQMNPHSFRDGNTLISESVGVREKFGGLKWNNPCLIRFALKQPQREFPDLKTKPGNVVGLLLSPLSSLHSETSDFALSALKISVDEIKDEFVTQLISDLPEKTEPELNKLVPDKLKSEFNAVFVQFGRDLCQPVSPWCSKCPIEKLCPKIGVKRQR